MRSVIGDANDLRDVDGRDVLSCKQAFDAALHWIDLRMRGGPAECGPDMTVGDAARASIAIGDARRSSQAGRELHSDA